MTGDERDDETAQAGATIINVASGPVNGTLIQLGSFAGDLVVQAPKSDEPD